MGNAEEEQQWSVVSGWNDMKKMWQQKSEKQNMVKPNENVRKFQKKVHK